MCADIKIDQLKEGDKVDLYVNSILGSLAKSDTTLIYHSSPKITANFVCKEATLEIGCYFASSNAIDFI